MKSTIVRELEDTKSELMSERPPSAYSEQLPNMTMSSGFGDVEEMRQKLAEASIELEELREH